jgi:hypothetical protein
MHTLTRTRLRRTRSAASALLALALGAPLSAGAFSLGAPICEVTSLPLVPMSATLASPPPAGWRLQVERPIYMADQVVRVRITHPVSTQSALGVLVWAKRGAASGAGAFAVDGGLYQHVPLPTDCGQWAVTHTSPVAKSQAELQFDWLPGEGGEVILRAFLIENCGVPGGCRGHQALTPIVVLRPAVFFDSFESGD